MIGTPEAIEGEEDDGPTLRIYSEVELVAALLDEDADDVGGTEVCVNDDCDDCPTERMLRPLFDTDQLQDEPLVANLK